MKRECSMVGERDGFEQESRRFSHGKLSVAAFVVA
jgi:hypothetical protein